MPEGAATPVTSSGRHYLDHASTTPLRPAARVLMTEWLERLGSAGGVGDPARIHEEGRVVREAVEAAREQVASLCHVSPSRIVFTSGATEAANTAIADAVAKRPGSPMVAAAVEHSCVREAAERLAPVLDPGVGPDATVDVASLEQLLVDHREGRDLALVNCQWANHEVGTVQPVEAVSALCRPGSRASPAAVPLHVDAAAAAGHMGIDVGELGADYVSLSAHKLGGPPGVGALVLGRGVRLRPLIAGGAQERARRAGMENVLGVVGFGAAADAIEAALPAEAALARRLTDRIVAAASAIRGVRALGVPRRRLPHVICLSVEGVLGEAILLALDRAGVAAHSGSACSSESLDPSPVLEAMGEDPDRSLRLSVGWSSTESDVDAFVAAFGPAVEKLRALGSRVS